MRCASCSTDWPEPSRLAFCGHCGAPLRDSPPRDPLLGQTLAQRYRVVRLLDEGGMGRVYEAEQALGQAVRKVAVKVLLPDLARDPATKLRFSRECELAASLEHPNIVHIYEFGETEGGRLFIAMELVSGRPLRALMDERGALSLAEVDRLLAQICGALQVAHDKGIVHRDLKPDNIMVTAGRTLGDFVKILDFGIARRLGPDAAAGRLTREGQTIGTAQYMSPEQVSARAIDTRSDLYAIGVIAYELLTGRLPFDAQTMQEWAAAHLSAAPFPFEHSRGGAAVPAGARAAVLRALEKDPARRPATAEQFYAEFHAGAGPHALAALPGGAPPAPADDAGGGHRTSYSAPAPESFGAAPGRAHGPPPTQAAFQVPPVSGGGYVTPPSSAHVSGQAPPGARSRWLLYAALAIGAVVLVGVSVELIIHAHRDDHDRGPAPGAASTQGPSGGVTVAPGVPPAPLATSGAVSPSVLMPTPPPPARSPGAAGGVGAVQSCHEAKKRVEEALEGHDCERAREASRGCGSNMSDYGEHHKLIHGLLKEHGCG